MFAFFFLNAAVAKVFRWPIDGRIKSSLSIVFESTSMAN